MPGFMIVLEGSARGWYLFGTVFFELLGLALTIAGFATLGVTWGIVGIVVMLVSGLFLIDAIMNFT
jgi:hypothetical protein